MIGREKNGIGLRGQKIVDNGVDNSGSNMVLKNISKM